MRSSSTFLMIFVTAIFSMATACASAQDGVGKSYQSKEFTLEGAGKLVVQTSGGSIEVSGRNSNMVLVEMLVRKGNKQIMAGDEAAAEVLEKYDIDISKSGNTVSAIAKRKSSADSWFNFGDNISISFRVSVPKQVSSNLHTSGGSIRLEGVAGTHEVKTSGGSLTFNDIEGDLTARTSGGSIKIDRYAGLLDAHTSGGSIRLEDAKGTIKVHTSGGNISLDNVQGSIVAKTSGGGIEANLLNIRDHVELKTSGGSIRATVPKGLGLNLDLKGNRVNTRLINFDGEAEKDRIRGQMNGGGIPVVMATSGGSVSLEYQ